MTEGPVEIALAAEAQARGMAAAAAHVAWNEALLSGATGSQVAAVEPASGLDDTAVTWTGTGGVPAATFGPASSSVNQLDPTDSSLSYGR